METSTDPAPSDGDFARTELSRIMSDPSHSMHEGFKRNDPRVNEYLDGIYRKAYGTAPISSDNQGIEILTPLAPAMDSGALSSEERAGIDIDAQLRVNLGPNYDATMISMRHGAERLFGGVDAAKVLDVLAPAITNLGPAAEVAAIKFLAELGRLNHHNQ